MTGPEHFAQAQNLLKRADATPAGSTDGNFFLAQAQVHATLALTAATLNPNRLVREESGEWDKAMGVPR